MWILIIPVALVKRKQIILIKPTYIILDLQKKSIQSWRPLPNQYINAIGNTSICVFYLQH